jgi:hypothetical protein
MFGACHAPKISRALHCAPSNNKKGIAMHRRWVGLLVWCLALGAIAAEKIDAIGLILPDRLGTFELKDRREFSQRALGVNVAYMEPRSVTRGSIFIYDGGAKSIPSGIDAPLVQRHFAQVISEVLSLEKLGQARSVRLTDTGVHRTQFSGCGAQFSGCGAQFLWREYDMDVDGTLLKSATYLTAVDNNFVKLRMTYRGDMPESRKQVENFVADVSKLLGRCT